MTAANLVNMGIAYAIFLPYAIYVRGFSIPALLVLIPITVAFFVFTSAIAMLLAAAMVYFRDVEFLIGIVLSAWFYGVPVIYSFTLIKSDTIRFWLNRDPVVPFINAYREAVFYRQTVSAPDLAYLYAIALITWFVSYSLFNRLKVRVAEEL
jgi:lipopolysaccharide transport system permease protein